MNARMLIVDAHQDIAYNALTYGRDYTRPVLATRRTDPPELLERRGLATLGLPDALLGRVGIVFSTIFTAPYDPKEAAYEAMSYKTPAEAHRLGLKQLDYYQRLVDTTNGKAQIIRRQADLEAVLASWADGTGVADHRQGLVLLMENGDPILEPKQFEEWYERGVRIVGPAWEATRYTAGTGKPGPLTTLGYELLDVMAGFNAVLDISHMAEQAARQALDHYPGIIIASHSNPQKFRTTDRHLPDATIRALAERDGVMGIVLYNKFLSNDWSKGDRKDKVTLDIVLDAIEYVCQLTGSAAHVGIGSDFDGGFGAESIPQGIDTVTDLLAIGKGLAERGFSPADVEAVMSGNMLRKLRQALPT
jgi:membrane dipeptidase